MSDVPSESPEDWCGDCTPEGTKACPMKPTCAEVAAQRGGGEPNYGTCENHPYHVCRCTDADREWAKSVRAFLIPTAQNGPSNTTPEEGS